MLFTLLVALASIQAQTGTAAPPHTIPSTSATTDALKARYDLAADYSAKHAGRALLIQKDGRVVYERYDNGGSATTPQPLASGTKSFTGVAAMFAVQDALLTLDEKVADTITEWKSDPKKAQITVRHLLNLSSGLKADADGVKERNRDLGAGKRNIAEVAIRLSREDWFATAINAPMTGTAGGQFEYGGNHFYAFGELLERKLKASTLPHKSVWDYYTARIFDPIGLNVARIGKDRAGHPNLPGGCSLTAQEWVKFGQFVLNNGTWTDGKGEKVQLLKPDLLAQCFVPSDKNPSYGLTFWLRRSAAEATDAGASQPETGTARERLGQRLARRNFDQQTRPLIGPDGKPIEVYMAAGLGGQKLYILPQYDTIIVRMATIGSPAGRGFDDKLFISGILGMPLDEEPTAPKP